MPEATSSTKVRLRSIIAIVAVLGGYQFWTAFTFHSTQHQNQNQIVSSDSSDQAEDTTDAAKLHLVQPDDLKSLQGALAKLSSRRRPQLGKKKKSNPQIRSSKSTSNEDVESNRELTLGRNESSVSTRNQIPVDVGSITVTKNPNRRQPGNTFVQGRSFPVWKLKHNKTRIPCFRPTGENVSIEHWSNPKLNLRKPADTGLLFVKLLKTVSSTAASIHLRIARNEANRQHNKKLLLSDRAANIDTDNNNVDKNNNSTDTDFWPVCKTRHLHGTASRQYQYSKRNKTNSFLWSRVRDPTKRHISEFFHFEVSRGGKDQGICSQRRLFGTS
jgi:hypothetical protein